MSGRRSSRAARSCAAATSRLLVSTTALAGASSAIRAARGEREYCDAVQNIGRQSIVVNFPKKFAEWFRVLAEHSASMSRRCH